MVVDERARAWRERERDQGTVGGREINLGEDVGDIGEVGVAVPAAVDAAGGGEGHQEEPPHGSPRLSVR